MNLENKIKLKVIGVDCWALRKNGGGARFVFESLLLHFKYDKYKFILFMHSEAKDCIKELQAERGIFKNVIKITIENPSDIYTYSRYVDLLYCPFNSISYRLFEKPVVSVLHDVQEKFFPEFFSKSDYNGRLEVYSDILRASDSVITISEFCKQSFKDKYDAELLNVHVVYNAAQEALVNFSNSVNKQSLKMPKEFPRKKKFILYPANFYKHKNHTLLFDAYASAKEKNIDLPLLVLVGSAWPGDQVFVNINEKGLSENIYITSDLSFSELAWLYKNCLYVVLPTLFEGFCLPAVEAMLFGKLVVCSDIPILREVTGEMGSYFDPFNPVDLLDALVNACLSESVINNQLINKRSLYSKRYDWKKSAQETIGVFEKTYDDYFACNLISSVSRSKFSIVLNSTDINQDWFNLTIGSILNNTIIPNIINVIIIGSESNYNYSDNSSSLRFIFVNDLSEAVNQVNDSELVSIVNVGTRLSVNYFLNCYRSRYDNRSSILIGELKQVHEDVDLTYERDCYFRLVDNAPVLSGTLHSEMFVFANSDILSEYIRKYGSEFLVKIITEQIHSNNVKFVRRDFGNVRYRNSLSYQVKYNLVDAVSSRVDIYNGLKFNIHESDILNVKELSSAALSLIEDKL